MNYRPLHWLFQHGLVLVAGASFLLFVLGLALDFSALPLFALTASSFVMLVAVGDYAPPASARLRDSEAIIIPVPAATFVRHAPERLAA